MTGDRPAVLSPSHLPSSLQCSYAGRTLRVRGPDLIICSHQTELPDQTRRSNSPYMHQTDISISLGVVQVKIYSRVQRPIQHIIVHYGNRSHSWMLPFSKQHSRTTRLQTKTISQTSDPPSPPVSFAYMHTYIKRIYIACAKINDH